MEEYLTGMRVVTTSVPWYSIWVEGDNTSNSRDSRYEDHGPVSKKLLVGVAEYRVWPPWRIGKLDNTQNALIMKNDDSTGNSIYTSGGASVPPKYRSRSYWA